jgi:hypothetical protein
MSKTATKRIIRRVTVRPLGVGGVTSPHQRGTVAALSWEAARTLDFIRAHMDRSGMSTVRVAPFLAERFPYHPNLKRLRREVLAELVGARLIDRPNGPKSTRVYVTEHARVW